MGKAFSPGNLTTEGIILSIYIDSLLVKPQLEDEFNSYKCRLCRELFFLFDKVTQKIVGEDAHEES